MSMMPIELGKREFARVLRGYDPKEVHAFLDLAAGEIETLRRQNTDLLRKITELETQLKDYHSVEKAIQQTFMQAQETSGKAIENARKEAQLIIQEAELKASQIVDKARADLTSLREQITILKAKKDSIVSRLKMLLNSELELVRALEVDEELQAGKSVERDADRANDQNEIEEIIRSLDKNA